MFKYLVKGIRFTVSFAFRQAFKIILSPLYFIKVLTNPFIEVENPITGLLYKVFCAPFNNARIEVFGPTEGDIKAKEEKLKERMKIAARKGLYGNAPKTERDGALLMVDMAFRTNREAALAQKTQIHLAALKIQKACYDRTM